MEGGGRGVIFLRELPKAIRFNALLAVSGACVFIVGYEATMLARSYGAFSLIVGCALIGSLTHALVIICRIWKPNGLGYGSEAMIMTLAYMAPLPRFYWGRRFAEVYLRIAPGWTVCTFLVLLGFYRGDIGSLPVLVFGIGTLLTVIVAMIVSYSSFRRRRRELAALSRLVETFRETSPKDL